MITIYSDLDGVIFDFMTPYKKLLGEWEVAQKDKNFTSAVYDHKIFETLELLPHARNYLKMLDEYTEYPFINVEILSSTASAKDVEQQKEVVRQKNLCLLKYGIPYRGNFTIHKGIKKQFATPKSILIDDLAINVKEFTDAGGYGILYEDGMDLSIIHNVVREVIQKENVGIY